MSNGNDDGAFFHVIGAIIAFCLIVVVVAAAIALCLSVGVAFGAGHSLYNYARALRANVRPEKLAN